MDMSERKLKILQAIIMNYLETAEPVGSRTISRRFMMNLSSATIRNEMSDLEDMGLIEQPHTSAGRIPSVKGYRLYVDSLMDRQLSEGANLNALLDLLKDKSLELDTLLREIGDVMATLTKYTTVVAMPPSSRSRLRQVQLIKLDETSCLLVVVLEGNIVHNHVAHLNEVLSETELYVISSVLNHELCGLTADEMNLKVISRIKRQCRTDEGFIDTLMDDIKETMRESDDSDVFTSGAANILSFPEFSDIDHARSLMDFFSQKDQVRQMVDHTEPEGRESELNISIGPENEAEQLQDCSIVTAKYAYNGKNIGSICVVGPMRMNYTMVVSALEGLKKGFPQLFESDGPDSAKKEDKNGREADQ